MDATLSKATCNLDLVKEIFYLKIPPTILSHYVI
jgi:hypothetical protein